jgi:hypothetical protein
MRLQSEAARRKQHFIFYIHGSVHRKYIFKYNQQGATLHNVFISVKFSTCFRRVLRPSSGAQNCIHSIGYLPGSTAACPTLPRQWQVAVKPGKYPMLCIQFWAPDDGRRTSLKHVENFTEINTLCNVASCWLYVLENKKKENIFFTLYNSEFVYDVINNLIRYLESRLDTARWTELKRNFLLIIHSYSPETTIKISLRVTKTMKSSLPLINFIVTLCILYHCVKKPTNAHILYIL